MLKKKPWLWIAPIGLTLIGAGVSLVGEAIVLRAAEASVWAWFGWGTAGLVVLNSGVSIFGLAVVKQAQAGRQG